MINTERLILRSFTDDDIDDLYEFLYQLKDDEFEGYPGFTYDNCSQYLHERIDSGEYCAIVLKESGKVIGNIYCGIRDYDSMEAGYIINNLYQRRGYAREALKAFVNEAFRSGVHRVYAECDPRNTASWKLLERAGFVREAHFRKNVYFHKAENGEPIWKDTYVYAILNEDKTN